MPFASSRGAMQGESLEWASDPEINLFYRFSTHHL